MEQIDLVFFLILSFFSNTESRIISEHTQVTVNTDSQEITIVHDGFFSIIQSTEDSTITRTQWNNLKSQDTIVWSPALEQFTDKEFTFTPNKTKGSTEAFKAEIKLKYPDTESLRKLGIWYNAETVTYSINHIPQQNISTDNGKLVDNYWMFELDKNNTFRFTLEPFLNIPDDFKKFKISVTEL